MSTGELDIHLLGHPQFVADGEPIKLAKRSVTIPLAAYLVLHRDEWISRSFLAFTLWANEPEETALSELRRYVYLLNKALPHIAGGESWIRADDDVLRWNETLPAQIDVVEFERLSASPETYADAVRAYTGDLLEDTYDDWVVSYRERLRAMYAADLGGLIVRYRDARDFKKAAEYASALLVADPWREDVLRQLMACRYESGDGAGALAEYERFVKRLRAELGVDPMPETAVVRDAIVRSAPLPASLGVVRVPDEPAPGAGRPLQATLPFGGRDLELEQLRASWVRAARGNGGIAFVSGQAGMGKSRLVAELAKSVEAEGGRVSVGSTSVQERFPYEGIVEALRFSLPFVASVDLDTLRASIIALLVPELSAWRKDLTDVPPVEPSREQARLLDAVSVCIERMARPRPMLFILEDLHWAGAATVSAIAFLARRLSRSAVLIVGTYREEEVGRTHPLRAIHRELRGAQPMQTLALRPLSAGAVRSIVGRLPIDEHARDALAQLGYDRSEGNPLFLTEALREAMSAEGTLTAAGSEAWTGTNALRDLIAARVSSLSDGGQDIARLAAVAGHAFHVDVLRDLAGVDESAILDGIYELIDRHIVREAGGRGRYDFVFTHHLIHRAVYESIEPPVRSRRHRRIAQILEDRPAEASGFGAASLALHRERAGEFSRAAASYVDAADHAIKLFANDDAIRHAGKAIELADDDRTRARALLVREQAYARSGKREEQAADIGILSDLCTRIDDDDLIWETVMRRLRFARSQGDREKQDAAVGELEQRSTSSGDLRRRAQALLGRADYLAWLTSHSEARAPAEEALRLYERVGDQAGQIEAMGLLAEIATNTGDATRSRELIAALRKRAEGYADQRLVLRAISSASIVALQERRIDDAAELAHEGLLLSRSIGDHEEEASTLQRLATVASWQRDFDTSRRLFSEAADAMGAIGDRRGISHALSNQVVLAMRLGLLDEAEALSKQVLEIGERTGERRPVAVTNVNMSFTRLLRGDHEAAKAYAREGLRIAREIKFPLFEGAALSNLGNAERVGGDIRAAIRHIKEGIALRTSILAPGDLLDDYCDLAVAHLQGGDRPAARAVADTILQIAGDSAEGAFWPHYCFWVSALVRRACGDATESKALLGRAVAAMDAFSSSISDEKTMAAFLALPLNRDVTAAARRDEWPSYAHGAADRYTPPKRRPPRRTATATKRRDR
jgi:predicted ATPase/DNA-binding SARP family transcriptional activator